MRESAMSMQCCCAPRPAEAAQQLPPELQQRFRPLAAPGTGAVHGLACAADTPTLHSLLRHARDEGLRQAAWEACHRQPAANLAALDQLVEVGGQGGAENVGVRRPRRLRQQVPCIA